MFLTYPKVKKHSGFIQPLQAIEKAQGSLHSTLQTARLLAKIQQELNVFLEQNLGMNCHVIRLDHEKLVLAVPNSAMASKLRQLAPSIAQHLQQYGYLIQQLNIKIHAGLNSFAEAPRQRTKNTSHRHQQFKQAFAKLLTQEPESPLAPTIARLLNRTTR